jgi:hypothetical protein
MSKKTLNESTVRRFMGLANIQPTVVSNYMKENYMNEEEPEDLEGEEEAPMDMGAEEEPALDAAPEEPPMDDMGDEEGMDMDGVDISPEEAQVLIDLGKKLEAAMPADEEEPEAAMDEPMDAEEPPMDDAEAPPMDDMGGEEEEEMLEAALKDVKVELSEQEVVQEVARRVARRILKAKNAQAELNEALGRKK